MNKTEDKFGGSKKASTFALPIEKAGLVLKMKR